LSPACDQQGDPSVLGLMQQIPLLTSSLIEHAARNHGATEIVSRTAEGTLERTNWREVASRARRVAGMLKRLGVGVGDRVATLAWNRTHHLELYYGVTGSGVVLHTVNPRLFGEQITYILNHADSSHVFVDVDLLPILEPLARELTKVKAFIVLTERSHMPRSGLKNLLCYEDLLEGETDEYEWPVLDENSASTLCYTSGTTGNPKGVLYSHRSTVLHAFCAVAADGMALSARDSVLLATPLFHVNAWGVPFAAAMCGAKLVLAGAQLDGRSLYELLRDERCTFSLGVPTLWFGVMDYIEGNVAEEERRVLELQRVLCGGAAPPRALLERLHRVLGVDAFQAWGMTETSPLATVCRPLAKHAELEDAERIDLYTRQGRPVFGIELRIENDEGRSLPRDGVATGELKVRGPWVASGYFKGEGGPALSADGWFATGDVARIDPDGFLQLTDRSKDVIKSGGEWISSIDLENAAVGYPGVAEAAVIGVPHPKWQERPLLLVRTAPGHTIDRESILSYLSQKVARWWLPDDVVVVDELPHTATGKLLKTELRARYRDYLLPKSGTAGR
jgi:acyl-CoA synthetase (AMP-forming)/AMP-acid ligase II